MSTRAPRRLVVAIALLLVTVPLWAPPLDVTGPDYRNTAAELSAENGTLAVDYENADRRQLPAIEGIDCAASHPLSARRCLFDGGTIDGNVTGVNPDIVAVSHSSAGEEILRGPTDEYVLLGDTVYRRTATFVAANDSVGMTVELGVEPVDPTVALADVATPADRLSEPAKTAIREGETTTNKPLKSANHVVELDGRYYVIYETGSPQFLSAKPAVERVLEALCVAAGALLLLRR